MPAPGKCVFNNLWTIDEKYKEAASSDRNKAKRKVCCKEFDIGRMGESALKVHMNVVQACKDDKDCLNVLPDASAAYLGPNFWDDSKVDYIDLDSFLDPCPEDRKLIYSGPLCSLLGSPLLGSTDISSLDSVSVKDLSDVNDNSSSVSVECKFSPSDLALATAPGQKHYDPASTVFPEDELKPQPIIKKSRKNFVPDNLKDDKYWSRRHKNNIAAKRSREARRVKENQIVLRASYLEKENSTLKEDVMCLKAENDHLKSKLKKYQS